MTLVWLDGALQPREEARLSVDDLAVLYGAACFETMRAFGGIAFRLERHLDRLYEGLDAIHVSPPARDVLRSAIAAALSANGLREARIRLTVTPGRGVGRPDLRAANGPTVLVVVEPAPDDPVPARVAVASLRIDEARHLAFAKTANYLPSLLALDEARSAGCDEALLLNRLDRVAECATSNVFAVLDGRLVTPPRAEGPLPGVTREAVLECAVRLDLPAGERALTLEDLAAAEEVFLTNSVVGIRSVASIAGRWSASAAPGPITAAMQDEYRRLVGRECGIGE
ncbi:MAG: aminotransferase class IV [Dehalococcoidia bacterium]